MKVSSLSKLLLASSLFIFSSYSVSAYEIKHGYSTDNGMAYYGTCNDGKDLMVVEKQDGTADYEGPKGKGKVKGGMDKAARKACGESSAKKKAS